MVLARLQTGAGRAHADHQWWRLGVTEPWEAPWGAPPSQWNHYAKHRSHVGAASMEEYDISARETIRRGARFTYKERNGVPRVGYYDESRGLFTGLNQSERQITTRYPATEREVRGWREFTFR